jgi:Tat protein translocase TatB subunit
VNEIMFNIGMPELILIVVIALLVVGPKRHPDEAKSLGKGLSEFRKTAEDVTDSLKGTLQEDEPQPAQKEGKNGKNLLLDEKKNAERNSSEPFQSSRNESREIKQTPPSSSPGQDA